MNIQKINVKAAAAVALAVAGLCSCSDWTKPEALDVAPEMQENSEETLAAIRAFKQTDHKIVILGMEATAARPYSQKQHMLNMPDSADYIFVKNMDEGLSETIVPEINEVKRKYGTKVLADIDYISIEEKWEEMQIEKEDSGQEPGTEEEFAKMCEDVTLSRLECCLKYSCDGIMVSYNGTAASSVALVGRTVFMNIVQKWMEENKDKEVFVRGNIGLVLRNMDGEEMLYDYSKFLNSCKLIIYPVESTSDVGQINVTLRGYTRYEGFPSDRFAIEVTVPTQDDPAQYGLTPCQAAEWALSENEQFSRAGLCVENAQDDYLTDGDSYLNIRKAIAILNTQGQ